MYNNRISDMWLRLPVFVFALLISFAGLAQLTDTTCVQSRWISLKREPANADLFRSDTSTNHTDELLQVVRRLTENHKLHLFRQNQYNLGMTDWYPIDYDKELQSIRNDSVNSFKSDPFFEIYYYRNSPMTDSYGDDSVVVLPDGTTTFVYPPPEIVAFRLSDCSEIRIKENRRFDKKNKRYEYTPVGISFVVHSLVGEYEKFWVDLNELFSALEKPEQYPWYRLLSSKKYRGFQYMQVSCYD